MRLANKVAVVTGAAAGNGRAIVQRFAEEGADVVIADLNGDGMKETERLVRRHGRDALTVHCDVTKRDDVQRLVDAAAGKFGKVDIMVANAGIADMDLFLEMDDETWDRVLDVNLKGVFLSDQIAARQMVQQGHGGRIINIASIMAELGSPTAASYCASKAGVKSLTKSAALALAPFDIRVNAIGPGYIETDMTEPLRTESALRENIVNQTPLGAMGDPVDVADAALFLASDQSKFMTGQTIFPDGGFLLNYLRPSLDVIDAGKRLLDKRKAERAARERSTS